AHETHGLIHLAGNDVVDSIPWAKLGHSDYADALAVDSITGGIWLGYFRGGLQLVKNGQVLESYAAADGLPQGRVNDLRVGRDGALWAATAGGASRLKNGRIAT